MSQKESNNFCQLSTVGPAKEEMLNEYGYFTFHDLALAHPLELNVECNIVLASATQIIVESLDKLSKSCPECNHDIEPAWARAQITNPNTENEVHCKNCSWSGNIDESTKDSDKKGTGAVTTISN